MTGRRWPRHPLCPPGHQRHHLVPLALLARPQLATFLTALAGGEAMLTRFSCNGLILPATEKLAMESSLALHRGPHPAYSDVVAARVDQIRATSVLTLPAGLAEARARVRTLQAALRRALTDRHGQRFWLNRRDPMRVFADRSYLDDAIAALYAVAAPSRSDRGDP